MCFVVLVNDNTDFNEETITGAGTTHHTNGIVIQKMRELSPFDLSNLPLQTGNWMLFILNGWITYLKNTLKYIEVVYFRSDS